MLLVRAPFLCSLHADGLGTDAAVQIASNPQLEAENEAQTFLALLEASSSRRESSCPSCDGALLGEGCHGQAEGIPQRERLAEVQAELVLLLLAEHEKHLPAPQVDANFLAGQ